MLVSVCDRGITTQWGGEKERGGILFRVLFLFLSLPLSLFKTSFLLIFLFIFGLYRKFFVKLAHVDSSDLPPLLLCSWPCVTGMDFDFQTRTSISRWRIWPCNSSLFISFKKNTQFTMFIFNSFLPHFGRFWIFLLISATFIFYSRDYVSFSILSTCSFFLYSLLLVLINILFARLVSLHLLTWYVYYCPYFPTLHVFFICLSSV